MLICAREECAVGFYPKTHNQKYCGTECCRIETNRRIMEKYYEKREREAGKIRFCSACKSTKLSRYNHTNICGGCALKAEQESRQNILNMVTSLSA